MLEAGPKPVGHRREMAAPDLRWPCCPSSSVPEIIAHNQAENEPSGADRALQRTADLRFSDTRVVAHRDFNHAESSQRAFKDHLNRPAIGGFFERKHAQYICPPSAKGAEITDF